MITCFFFLLEPRIVVQLSPLLVNGTSNEDPIELLCTAIVTEDIILASYQFTWMKNDASVNFSDSIYTVYTLLHLYLFYFCALFSDIKQQ